LEARYPGKLVKRRGFAFLDLRQESYGPKNPEPPWVDPCERFWGNVVREQGLLTLRDAADVFKDAGEAVDRRRPVKQRAMAHRDVGGHGRVLRLVAEVHQGPLAVRPVEVLPKEGNRKVLPRNDPNAVHAAVRVRHFFPPRMQNADCRGNTLEWVRW